MAQIQLHIERWSTATPRYTKGIESIERSPSNRSKGHCHEPHASLPASQIIIHSGNAEGDCVKIGQPTEWEAFWLPLKTHQQRLPSKKDAPNPKGPSRDLGSPQVSSLFFPSPCPPITGASHTPRTASVFATFSFYPFRIAIKVVRVAQKRAPCKQNCSFPCCCLS